MPARTFMRSRADQSGGTSSTGEAGTATPRRNRQPADRTALVTARQSRPARPPPGLMVFAELADHLGDLVRLGAVGQDASQKVGQLGDDLVRARAVGIRRKHLD